MKKILNKFTTYETVWFVSVVSLAILFAILFPEEDVNGVRGHWIMAISLLYTFLNVACELMISKQSKWNFIISLGVEGSEITMYRLLSYRWATMLTTLLFWIPIDIISFVSWSKYPDKEKKELTQVRALKGWQLVLVIAGIIAWTVGIGSLLCYLTDGILPSGLFAGRRDVEMIVCYLDALVSALDICNGTFILFRLREQWIAWYLEVIIDAICIVLAGQYVLLALTIGYLTNTTYGFIKWSRYAKEHSA